MDGWKEYKLNQLGALARGKSKHRPRDAKHLYGGKYPFIQTGDVKAANHKITSFTQNYSEAGLAQSKLWPVNTMCITIAANIAETGVLTFPACFPDSIIGFEADAEKCDIFFIEYMMQHFKKQVQTHAIGSVQDNINLGTFDRVKFLLPTLPEQRRIAEILGALDDKIELNLSMNKTLEEMAMAIYKEWFVDFGPFQSGEFVDSELDRIPKGWKVKSISDIAQLKYGKALKKTDRLPGEYPVYGSSGVIGSHEEYLIESPAIIIGRKGNIGSVFWEDKHCFPIDTVYYINNYPVNILRYIYFKFKSTDFKSRNSDSVVPGLNRNLVHRELILLPTDETLEKFESFIEPVFHCIENNKKENHTLAQTRDALLPKLISGEVRVKTAEEQIEETLN